MKHTVNLFDLSEAQIGALFVAALGPMWRARTGWFTHDLRNRIAHKTFDGMLRLGLFEASFTPGGKGRIGRLTPAGYALADLAITASRSIAAAIAGRNDRSFLPVVSVEDQTTAETVAETNAEPTLEPAQVP